MEKVNFNGYIFEVGKWAKENLSNQGFHKFLITGIDLENGAIYGETLGGCTSKWIDRCEPCDEPPIQDIPEGLRERLSTKELGDKEEECTKCNGVEALYQSLSEKEIGDWKKSKDPLCNGLYEGLSLCR